MLHTWDQRLRAHFHLHGLIASGARTPRTDRGGSPGAAIPVSRAWAEQDVSRQVSGRGGRVAGTTPSWSPPGVVRISGAAHRRHWLRQCRKRSWVVYLRPRLRVRGARGLPGPLHPSGGDQQPPPLSCQDGQVHYRYRDRGDGDRLKTDPSGRGVPGPIPAARIAGRFLSHPALRSAGQWRQARATDPLPPVLGATSPRRRGAASAHRRRLDATPASGNQRRLRPRTVPGVRGLEQFLNGGLPMGHPKLLRDIFKACIPRPPGHCPAIPCTPRPFPTPRPPLFVAIRVRQHPTPSLATRPPRRKSPIPDSLFQRPSDQVARKNEKRAVYPLHSSVPTVFYLARSLAADTRWQAERGSEGEIKHYTLSD